MNLELAAEIHALEVLGEEQFNNVEFVSAKQSIIEDFISGASWAAETIKNMTLIEEFMDHFEEKTGNEIPGEIFESFFE